MNAAVSDGEHDVERVARALAARGSLIECVAMLRGAVARDPSRRGCADLLQRVLDEGPSAQASTGSDVVELDLPLVDRWIRTGLLVEALALLSGTPMGSLETGREWAQLLGELLAPVPVDAEEVMVAMHEQLLTGGASVAMSLLEDRAKEAPPPAAWALRRLELLRWMLLDNAAPAHDTPRLPREVPSLLAGAIREGIHQRNLAGTVDAAKAFAAEHPDSEDAQLIATSLEALAAEVEAQSGMAQTMARTIPVFGRPAAALQLRMCNLANAASVYRRVLEGREDPEVAALATYVRFVECALAGEPLHADAPPTLQVPLSAEEELTSQLYALAEASQGRSPDADAARATREKSGPVAIAEVAATEQMPSAAEHVMRLVAEGRHEEAQKVREAMSLLFDDEPTEPTIEEDELKARAGREDTPTDRPSGPEFVPSRSAPATGAHPKASSLGAPATGREGVVVQKIRSIE